MRPTHPLHDEAFAFLGQLSQHLRTHGVSTEARDAVATLTATADPAHAARLRPGVGEPPALVERLAVWALHRVEPEVIRAAGQVLGGGVHLTAPAPSTTLVA